MRSGGKDTIAQLVNAGFDLNAKNNQKKTPRHYAVGEVKNLVGPTLETRLQIAITNIDTQDKDNQVSNEWKEIQTVALQKIKAIKTLIEQSAEPYTVNDTVYANTHGAGIVEIGIETESSMEDGGGGGMEDGGRDGTTMRTKFRVFINASGTISDDGMMRPVRRSTSS